MTHEIIGLSWKRSFEYSLSPDYIEIPSVTADELGRRIDAMTHVISVVDSAVASLPEILADQDYSLGFVDADGVILKMYRCSYQYMHDFAPGKIWTEEAIGTTSVGLALITGRVALIDHGEHYYCKFKSVLAVGYPIYMQGQMLGVITLALHEREGRKYLINLLSVIVKQIEEELLLQETFAGNLTDCKSLEQILRTFLHEIKNPLTNVRAFLQIEQRNAEDSLRYQRMIMEVDRISSMIENFRHLSIGNEYELKPVDLTAILQGIYPLLKNVFDLNGWQLNLSTTDSCRIMGNENRLKQVFLNILKNAYEALTENGRVDIILRKTNAECVVQISDNGHGIAREKLEQVFQPFYTSKAIGYGLGLTICREIITRHNGHIFVESEEHRCTTVTIIVPCLTE